MKQATMEETERTEMTDGKALVAAPASGSDGVGGETEVGFGLGVGFALSPELARKVWMRL